MPSIMNEYPSKYLKAGLDIAAEETVVLTIRGVEFETVGQGEEAERKPILYFKEASKGLVLNKTNAKAVEKVAGVDYLTWPGKRITIVATDVEYKGELMLGLRVRTTPPKAEERTGLKSAPSAEKAM
jgi:hypothetical protein